MPSTSNIRVTLATTGEYMMAPAFGLKPVSLTHLAFRLRDGSAPMIFTASGVAVGDHNRAVGWKLSDIRWTINTAPPPPPPPPPVEAKIKFWVKEPSFDAAPTS